jgi:heme exporter protein A
MYAATFSTAGLSGARGGFYLFEDLSLVLVAGDALLVQGANGTGKSTLLRILAGLMPPADGAVRFAGPGEEPPLRHYLGHSNAIKAGLTVEQNIRFWAGFAARRDAAVEDALEDALDAFDLDELRDLPARYLSAGQKRRLALARLLASPAPLWLLDEPVTALDTRSVGLFEAAVARHRQGGGMAIIATHQDLVMPGAADLNLGRA